jgi:hypothetical protein
MKNNDFYSPMKSIVNLILTGERKIDQDGESITVVQEFIESLLPHHKEDYNLYFLFCIEDYLNNCSKEEKVDILKVLCENENLIHGVSLMNTIIKKPKSFQQNDITDTVDSVLLNFLTEGEAHPIITLSIYFYIESIVNSPIMNGEITKSDYDEILEFHSIKRDLKELFKFVR